MDETLLDLNSKLLQKLRSNCNIMIMVIINSHDSFRLVPVHKALSLIGV